MLLTDYKRDTKKTLSHLITLDDGSVISKQPVEIAFPKFFRNTLLYVTDPDIMVLGFLMIKVGNTYTALKVSTLIELGKGGVLTETTIDNGRGLSGECYIYTFPPGSTIFKSLDVVKYGAISYHLSYKIQKTGGKIPYFTKNDFLTCLDNLPLFNGVNLPEYGFVSIYSETCCRSPKDLEKPSRLSSKPDDYVNVPFKAILLSIDNTLSLLNGSHTEDGFQKALTRTSERASAIEEVLRI